ncbi:MAG: helix-turn-helix domain-containing protein [Bacteroidales bacterium]|nr:helix-turn-helix domain-containing protein [Bacteroidales bacterium]
MKEIDIEQLKNENWVEYNDGSLVIVDDISQMQGKGFTQVSLNLVVMLFCIKGKAEITINEKTLTVSKNDVLVISPNTFVSDYTLNKDFDCRIIGFSMDAIDSEMYLSKHVWKNIYYVFQNPVIRLKEKEMQVFYNYYYIAQTKLKDNNNIYYREIMHSLLMSLIYEFLVITDKSTKYIGNADEGMLHQGDILFKNFMELLISNKGQIRSVKQAADMLNVSSKYLSMVIKTSSGKNALDIIHHYRLREIIRRLKYTDKTIQEISYEMNFPSLSFLGKFFKQQTGMSPKQFRNSGGMSYINEQ